MGLLCGGVVRAQPAVSAVTGEAVLCANGAAAGFSCGNVDLMAFLPLGDLGGGTDANGASARANDLWGWTDPETGREYALLGREDGTAFVDISDPTNPVYLGDLPTHTVPSTWRDIKTYANHAFVVSEAPEHGMQVFDLTLLRDVTAPPVTFAETAHYGAVASAHNLVVNEETGFAYVVGAHGGGTTCGGALHMVNIQTPTNPTFAGCFQDLLTGFFGTGYTHDAQCVRYHGPDADYQGREICIGSNENAISIADVSDKAAPVAISRATYPQVGYVHQGWLTEDHRYFFQDDELDERRFGLPHTRTLIWDLADLDAPALLAEYEGVSTSADHNQYVVDQYVFQANYSSGLRILDIRDVAHPVEVAFFDTFPPDDAPSFNGAWSTYPFFESGVVLVSSREAGLFVVDPTGIAVSVEAAETPAGFALSAAYPNPFNPQTTLTLRLDAPQPVTVAVFDVLGRRVARLHAGPLAAGVHRLVFEAGVLPGGVYVVRAEGARGVQTQRVVLAK